MSFEGIEPTLSAGLTVTFFYLQRDLRASPNCKNSGATHLSYILLETAASKLQNGNLRKTRVDMTDQV